MRENPRHNTLVVRRFAGHPAAFISECVLASVFTYSYKMSLPSPYRTLCLPPTPPAMLMLPTLPSAAGIVQQPVGGVTATGLQTHAAILLCTSE